MIFLFFLYFEDKVTIKNILSSFDMRSTCIDSQHSVDSVRELLKNEYRQYLR